MSFKEVKELRQAGNLEDALNMARQDLERDSGNIWNKRSIAWVYHDYLKQFAQTEKYNDFIDILRNLVELELPEDEKMIFDTCAYQVGKLVFAFANEQQVDYSKINSLFIYVKNFNLTKSSESYSFLYKAFHKHYKNWTNYISFADWWGFDNFMSQDFATEEYEGRTIMAIAEQAYIAYSKKLLEGEAVESNGLILNNTINKEKINLFLPNLERLIDEHPEYQYPSYFKAKLLIAIGDKDNIFNSFLPFAKQKRNDFWVWDLIAEIFSEDEEIVFSCYCKALSLRTPEDFLVKLHQKLAAMLIQKEMYSEAKTEIEMLVAVRTKHDWKIPNQVNQWLKAKWYIETKSKTNNKDLYSEYSNHAEEILFQDIPEEIIAVEFVNENKNMLNFIKDKTKHGFFNYSKILAKPNIGDVLSVRFKGKGNDGFYKILTAKKVDSNIECKAIRVFNGLLKLVTAKVFGFVEDVFIEPKLIETNKLKDNQEIKGKAILSYNKKKEEWGWKAINITI